LEAVLDLDAVDPKKSKPVEFLLTLSRSEGLKSPEKPDMSAESSGVWVRPVVELLVDWYDMFRLSGLA
jgi:hypothetical protein